MKYKKFIFLLTEHISEGIWRWLPNVTHNLKKLTFIYLLIHKQISWSLAICKLLKYKNHNVDRVFAIKSYLTNCSCQCNFLVLKNSYPNLSSFFSCNNENQYNVTHYFWLVILYIGEILLLWCLPIYRHFMFSKL